MEHISGIAANLKGEVTAYGKGAEAIFGYTPSEILGKNVAVFHPPGAEATLQELFSTAMEKGLWEKDVVLVRKNGQHFRARLKVTAIRDKGVITGLLGTTREL